MRNWLRDRGLGVLFVSVFLVTWAGQLVFEWLDYANDERAHGADPTFWSEGFWASFWQSTFENWQSEFLQLLSFVVLTTYFIYRKSHESRDGQDEMKAAIERIEKQVSKLSADGDEVSRRRAKA